MGSKIYTCKPGQMCCIAVLALCICVSSATAQQIFEHRVQRGDTLWSISERYFGNPNLWPGLWEMNPFVTNPHLLKTGDLIRVGIQEPVALTVPETPKQQIEKPAAITEVKMRGIGVGKIKNLNGRGRFSEEQEVPWSTVVASDSQKLLLARGDLLFLDFAGRDGIKAGDEFMIFRPISQVRHVITGEDRGHLYSARARVKLKERTAPTIFSAEIQESYSDVNLGDLALPLVPAPSCVIPSPTDPGVRGVVIAAEEMHMVFGRNFVVYLDSGRDKGLVPGSMLELVRFSRMPEGSAGKGTAEAATDEKTVGRMVVLEVGPHTASALVLSTKEDLRVGASFRGSFSWSGPAESAKIMLTCTGE